MTRNTDINVSNLSGKLAIVTGASDGIGLVIARQLAAAGAEVLLPVRNAVKGKKAVDAILQAVPAANVSTAPLDLASLDSVAEFAERLENTGRPINILINNAGVMTPPNRQLTTDGFELQFGTNHLGHFALTRRLLPLLCDGNARVVHQTSIAARSGDINWDDLNWEQSYNGMSAYRQSKIAVGLFGRELNARSVAGNWGITSNISHPGVSPTNLLSAQPGMGRPNDTVGVRVIRLLSRIGMIVGTRETAALPALVAATESSSKGDQFYGPKGIGELGGEPAIQSLWSPLQDMTAASRIWESSEELVGERFVKSL